MVFIGNGKLHVSAYSGHKQVLTTAWRCWDLNIVTRFRHII